VAGALGLFEESLTVSRQVDDVHGVAMNLVTMSLVLLALGRVDEARDRLQEGLQTAQDLGDEELLKAVQEAAAVAERARAEGSARRADDASER
jgi:hypothetical protein